MCKSKTPVVNKTNDGVLFTTVGGILSKYIDKKLVLNSLTVGGILREKSKDPPTGVHLHTDRWLCLSN